ncbi:unnamed protein product, partial [Polarella glacialis]
ELDINTFPQPDDPSSTRIEGGAYALAERIAERLPPDKLRMGFAVASCKRTDATAASPLVLTSCCGSRVLARRAVFTVPPRLLAERVIFSPSLSDRRCKAMASSRTWTLTW